MRLILSTDATFKQSIPKPFSPSPVSLPVANDNAIALPTRGVWLFAVGLWLAFFAAGYMFF